MPSDVIVLENANVLSQNVETIADKKHILIPNLDGTLKLMPFDSPQVQYPLFEVSSQYLLTHLSQFELLLRSRHLEIKSMPQATLRQKYEFIIQLQGLLTLSNQHLNDLHQIYSKLDLIELAAEPLKQANTCLLEIRASQKNALYDFRTAVGLFVTPSAIAWGTMIIPQLKFTPVSTFTRASGVYSINMGFHAPQTAWTDLQKYPLSGRLKMQIRHDELTIPITPILQSDYAYYLNYGTSQTFENFLKESCAPTATFQSKCLSIPSWVPSYCPKTLSVAIPEINNVSADTLLLYLQTFVELMVLQPYHTQVVLYAPAEHAARFCALGFYPCDNNTPRKETLEKLVSISDYYKRPTEVYTRFSLKDENGEVLLRPFQFSLDEIETRRVQITEKKMKTTYKDLIDSPQTRLIDPFNHSQGVLPVFCQPQNITPLFRSIVQREQGRKWAPKVQCEETASVDYHWMANPRRLEEIGCSAQPDNADTKVVRRITYGH